MTSTTSTDTKSTATRTTITGEIAYTRRRSLARGMLIGRHEPGPGPGPEPNPGSSLSLWCSQVPANQVLLVGDRPALRFEEHEGSLRSEQSLWPAFLDGARAWLLRVECWMDGRTRADSPSGLTETVVDHARGVEILVDHGCFAFSCAGAVRGDDARVALISEVGDRELFLSARCARLLIDGHAVLVDLGPHGTGHGRIRLVMTGVTCHEYPRPNANENVASIYGDPWGGSNPAGRRPTSAGETLDSTPGEREGVP